MTLSDYLAGIAGRRFAYGALDCCTLMADWLVARGLPDVMADRRGAYATRADYEALIGAEGGIVKSCRRRFAAAGLRRTNRPAAGDVCLVRSPVLVGEAGAVAWAPTGAVAVSDRLRAVITIDLGLVVADLSIVQAWSLQ